jgi:hypothetical protein
MEKMEADVLNDCYSHSDDNLKFVSRDSVIRARRCH